METWEVIVKDWFQQKKAGFRAGSHDSDIPMLIPLLVLIS